MYKRTQVSPLTQFSIISGPDGGHGPLSELHPDPADQGALGPGHGAQGLHGRAGEVDHVFFYRVTIQVDSILLLTPNQKLRPS